MNTGGQQVWGLPPTAGTRRIPGEAGDAVVSMAPISDAGGVQERMGRTDSLLKVRCGRGSMFSRFLSILSRVLVRPATVLHP